jgi:hypothetical protein
MRQFSEPVFQMSSTRDRDLACRTAPRDPERALDLARRIPDDWFRAQALACVARHAAEPLVERLAEESVRSARQAKEPYRTAAVTAWPIRALIERGRAGPARRILAESLALLPQVQPVSSRAEALMLIWEAVFPAGRELRRLTLEAIARHCDPDAHWRAARLYSTVVCTLAGEGVEEAGVVVAQMPEGAARRKAAKLLESGTACPPRDFFGAVG